MAKLYFRHGAVGSAKTLNLLAVAHNYRMQSKRVFLMKPALDDRFGNLEITSRAGLSQDADMLLQPNEDLDMESLASYDCILVDEAQFLSNHLIDQLRFLTHTRRVPVICYGLRTDFRRKLFPGSQRLFEIADSIEEVKTTCAYCNRKGIYNLKLMDGRPTLAGPTVDLGADEKYQPACHTCYAQKLGIEDELGVAPSSGD